MSKSYKEILDTFESIRVDCGGEIALPQICVNGDQSSGKSSLLNALTGISFPVKSGTCTRCPTLVECRWADAVTHSIFRGNDFQSIEPGDMETEIVKRQKALLGSKKITKEPIRIRVQGPSQQDIDIVDLPGIIHNGSGLDETQELIREHIRSARTLILVVGEAKQDDELCTALKLAKEYDPNGVRTLRILTKFDTFDTEDTKKSASALLLAGAEQELGAHAVVCRAHGGGGYDSETEIESLSDAIAPEDSERVSAHAGVKSLRTRLSALYIRLLRTNLPNLECDAIAQRDASLRLLQKLGEYPCTPTEMILEAKRALYCPSRKITLTLTGPLNRFQKAVHETGTMLNEDFVKGFHVHDAFECPFFAGKTTYEAGVHKIVDVWTPLGDRLVKDVLALMETAMQAVDEIAVGVSRRLYDAIVAAWAKEVVEIGRRLHKAVRVSLDKERVFGTMNHYLESKYNEHAVLPDDLVDKIVLNIPVRCPDHAQMRECIVNSRKAYLAMDTSKSLEESTVSKVTFALQAVWSVEKKTFTDLMLKELRAVVVTAYARFVDGMQADQELIKNAVEDGDIPKERDVQKAKVARMNSVIALIHGFKECDALP